MSYGPGARMRCDPRPIPEAGSNAERSEASLECERGW